MAAVDVDQQIQIADGSCLAAGHRAEDPDVAHAEALAETLDRIAVCAYLVQRDGTPAEPQPSRAYLQPVTLTDRG